MVGGERLGDRTAAVVANEVDAIDAQSVEELGEHLGMSGEVHPGVGLRSRVTVAHVVDGDHPPH